jgi:hypothetical protein
VGIEAECERGGTRVLRRSGGIDVWPVGQSSCGLTGQPRRRGERLSGKARPCGAPTGPARAGRERVAWRVLLEAPTDMDGRTDGTQ